MTNWFNTCCSLSFFYYVIESVGLSAVMHRVCLTNALDLHMLLALLNCM